MNVQTFNRAWRIDMRIYKLLALCNQINSNTWIVLFCQSCLSRWQIFFSNSQLNWTRLVTYWYFFCIHREHSPFIWNMSSQVIHWIHSFISTSSTDWNKFCFNNNVSWVWYILHCWLKSLWIHIFSLSLIFMSVAFLHSNCASFNIFICFLHLPILLYFYILSIH